MMPRKSWALLVGVLWLSVPPPGFATGGSRWRIYRETDAPTGPLAVSVTVSPRGNVWVRQGGDSSASWLDGFQTRTIPDPGSVNFPVYESRSGQIWSLFADGAMEFRRDQWGEYPIAEIRAEIQSTALRYYHPIPLLPAERDHVLALLWDRLLEYDAGQGRTLVLKKARETELGRFNELVEARDGGAWVTGSNGLAKLPGPVRRLTADSKWQQALPDPSWRIQNLERPFEDDEGGVIVVADSSSTTGRVVLAYNGQSWQTPMAAPERARFAWRGADGALWVLTRNSLFKRERKDWEPVAIPLSRDAQYFDVAVEPNGVFWLATTEGLIRHAPQTWRTPPELTELKTAARALLDDGDGGLWIASVSGLVALRNGSRQDFPWPKSFSPTTGVAEVMYRLPAGQLVVSAARGGVFFDPRTEGFLPLEPAPGWQIKAFVGQLRDGRLCAQTVEPESSGRFRLELFDGRSFSPLFEPNADWSLGDEILFLHGAEDGALWLGTERGLGVWDDKAKTFVPANDFRGGRAACLLDIGKGRVWCASGDLIYEFNGKRWSVARAGVGRINALLKTRDGSIGGASKPGLHRFQDGSWMTNGAEDGLPSDEIYQVCQDRRGAIWAATAKGVSLYHRTADVDPPISTISPAENPKDVVYSTEIAELRYHGRDK